MLILARHKTETITITVPPSDKEQRIEITAIDFRRQNKLPAVRLGFIAEKVVRINRGEVQAKIDAEATA